MDTEKRIAQLLLDIRAVSLRPEEPFTWASGIKSPIYCDNRLILSYPEERTIVRDALVDMIRKQYPQVQVIMGTATAGIPMAALSAQAMELPMGYVRGDAKKHGKQNQIEGRLRPGQKVVIVEDLISTGGSVGAVVEALRQAGGDVLGVAAIFTYGLKDSEENFARMGVPFCTLSNYDVLIRAAIERNDIEAHSLEKLLAWKKDPRNEDWMR